MTCITTCTETSKLKALGGCSSHHLQVAGAYCDGLITGRTACYSPTSRQNHSIAHQRATIGLTLKSCRNDECLTMWIKTLHFITDVRVIYAS